MQHYKILLRATAGSANAEANITSTEHAILKNGVFVYTRVQNETQTRFSEKIEKN